MTFHDWFWSTGQPFYGSPREFDVLNAGTVEPSADSTAWDLLRAVMLAEREGVGTRDYSRALLAPIFTPGFWTRGLPWSDGSDVVVRAVPVRGATEHGVTSLPVSGSGRTVDPPAGGDIRRASRRHPPAVGVQARRSTQKDTK